MPRILAVDDDLNILDNVKALLVREGFDVDLCSTAEDAIWQVKQPIYDLYILDWQIPGTSGIELCQSIRRMDSSAAILLLTGMDKIADKTQGFDAGADDYLTKPFQLAELLARVKALLRRAPRQIISRVVKLGELEFDLETKQVKKGSEAIHLKPLECKVLEYLVRHPNELIEAQVLLDNVWGQENESTVASVYTTVARLRKKLGLTGADSPIQTSYGMGYRYIPCKE